MPVECKIMKPTLNIQQIITRQQEQWPTNTVAYFTWSQFSMWTVLIPSTSASLTSGHWPYSNHRVNKRNVSCRELALVDKAIDWKKPLTAALQYAETWRNQFTTRSRQNWEFSIYFAHSTIIKNRFIICIYKWGIHINSSFTMLHRPSSLASSVG